MALFKGALTVRRFRVMGQPPDDFRAVYPALLQDKAFHAPLGLVRGEELSGWCLVENLLETDFSGTEGWLFNQYAVLGVRFERKALPQKLVAATLAQRIRAWCEEHRRERAPASVRTELRELLEDELYARALPRVTVHEVVWNLAEGWVLVANAAEAVADHVRKLFRDTFGLSLVPATALDLVADDEPVLAALEVAGLTRLDGPAEDLDGDLVPPRPDALGAWGPTEVGETERALLPHTVSEFLLWLWWKTEAEEGRLDLGDAGIVDCWVDERVALRKADEDRSRTVLTGDNPSAAVEARAALAGGKVVRELSVGIRREGREYSVVLKGPELLFVGAKLPTECRGAQDEVLYERMYLYEDLHYVVAALYRAFAVERADAAWWRRVVVPALHTWARGEQGLGLGLGRGGDDLDVDTAGPVLPSRVPLVVRTVSGERVDAGLAVREGDVFVIEASAVRAGLDDRARRASTRGTAAQAGAHARTTPSELGPAQRIDPAPKPAATRPWDQLCEVADQALTLADDDGFDDETRGQARALATEAVKLRDRTRVTRVLDADQAERVRAWARQLRSVRGA